MPSSGMLRPVALVRTDVSEELSASFIRVTRIGELGTKLAVSRNRRTLQKVEFKLFLTLANVVYERFEVFTAVSMKNGIFWNVTTCGSCKNRRFGGA
jgi:hypothetical protein